MSNLIAKPVRQDHRAALAFDKSFENVTGGLERAAESIHEYAEGIFQSLDHREPGNAPSIKHASQVIRAHPITAAAAIATAVAALAGLVVTIRRPNAA